VEQAGPFTLRLLGPECVVEVEVCRVRTLFGTFGVVPKRVSGSAQAYKTFCSRMLTTVHL